MEADRQRLLAVERLILETICFNFTSRMPFPYVIKIGRELKGVTRPCPSAEASLSLIDYLSLQKADQIRMEAHN